MNRRHFLGTAAALPLLEPKRVLGANDRFRAGFMVMGRRANWLLGCDLPGAEVVTVSATSLPHHFGAQWCHEGCDQDGTSERQLASGVAAQVRALAKARKLSANKMSVELIESGMEAEKRKQREFFELAERFRSATDPEEVKRLGDQMGRMVLGA